jgi:hypothetical protein
MAARFVKVMRVRFPLPHGTVDVPRLLAALTGDAGTPRGRRDHKAGAGEAGRAPLPPRAEKADDSSVVVVRDDRMAVEDRGREQLAQTEFGLKAPPAKPRNRRSKSDESLSVGTIAATMAGVIVVSFAGTALLPSILTRDPVESTTIAIAPPAVQRPPDARPVQLPAPDLPAPASTDAKSVAKTAPVLRTTSVPSAKQAGGRTAGPTDLTAAEKAAVARGREDLQNTAAVAAPRRPATTRPALTAEEKAAVERGLRELEKAAGEAKQ